MPSAASAVTMAEDGIIKRFTNFFSKRDVPAEMQDPPHSTATARDFWVDWLESFGVDPSRTTAYADSEMMNRESPVISASLDAITDACVSGADGEAEEVFTVVFPQDAPEPFQPDAPSAEEDPTTPAEPAAPGAFPPPKLVTENAFEMDTSTQNEEIAALFAAMEARTQIKQQAWQQIRGFLMYGDEFGEVIIDTSEKAVARIKGLPPQSIVAVPDRLGELRNEYAYRQHDEVGRLLATFQPWQIVHFADRERTYDVYGRSHLAAVRRIYKQLVFVTDAMVVNRLTRSTMRYVHKIPTGNLSPKQAQAYVDEYRGTFTRKRSFDSRGKLDVSRNIWGEERDFFIPSGKDATGDVQAIQGQNGFDKIEDVKFFMAMLFAGLRIPPAFVGFEGANGGGDRAVVTGLDVAFGRVVRRTQQTHAAGMRQIYQTELALRGKNPQEVDFKFKYPALGTVDEMREWQVELLKAQVAQVLKSGTIITDDDYLLRRVLEVEDEYVERIKAANKDAEKKKAAELKAQMDAKAQQFGGGRFGGGGTFKPGASGPAKTQAMAQRGVDDATGVRPRKAVTERVRQARAPRALETAVDALLRRTDVRRQLHELHTLAAPLATSGGVGVSPGVAALQRAGGVV